MESRLLPSGASATVRGLETYRNVTSLPFRTLPPPLLMAPVVALTLLGATFEAGAAGQADKRSAKREGKFDKRIREVVEGKTGEAARVSVIIAVKPDARKGLIKRLLAHGATAQVGTEFSIIESFSATLPKRLVRQLEHDQDVVSVSVDAPVQGDGLASAVSGTPELSGYSLRSTLGLEVPSDTSAKASFQQGVNRYTGTVDGGINSLLAIASYGNSSSVGVVNGLVKGAMLVRFDGLFGDGQGRFPSVRRSPAHADRRPRRRRQPDGAGQPAPHAGGLGAQRVRAGLLTSGPGAAA